MTERDLDAERAAMVAGIRARYDAAGPHRKLARDTADLALERLTLEPEGRVRWPWGAVHEISSHLMPGHFVVLTARTEQGKTTLLLSLADALASDEAGTRVAMLGLEQAPDELWLKRAAMRCGIDPAVVVENAWEEFGELAEEKYEEVRAMAGALKAPVHADRLLLLPDRHINRARLEQAAADAAAFGANVLIVDHIHHIDHGDGKNSFAEFSATVQLCKTLAEDHGLVMLVAAQINRGNLQGDVLARYQAPRLENIQGGGTIEQVANKVFGVYRPLRPDASADDLKAVRAGRKEVKDVLAPGVMGVVCLKNRERGRLSGHRAFLAVERGRVVDEPVAARLEREAIQHAIKTGGAL